MRGRKDYYLRFWLCRGRFGRNKVHVVGDPEGVWGFVFAEPSYIVLDLALKGLKG